MRLGIFVGKATSLLNVGREIAYVAQRRGITTRLFTHLVPLCDIENVCDAAVLIIPASPIFGAKYMLAYRDYRETLNMPCILYTTVEGRIPRVLVKAWMLRDIEFIANSRYTREKLEEVGFSVRDVIPHGLVREVIQHARLYGRMTRRRLEAKFGAALKDKVIFGVVSSSHRRKGLDYLAKAVEYLAQKRKDFTVYVLSDTGATKFIRPSPHVIIDTNFGNLNREDVLTLIASFDYLVMPSLAEGFGLPLIEANALGRPVIHCAYPPLTENSDPSINLTFPYLDIELYDCNDGILYELHVYDPRELALTMEEAIEMLQQRRSEYEQRSETAQKILDKYDAETHYTRLLQHLGVE